MIPPGLVQTDEKSLKIFHSVFDGVCKSLRCPWNSKDLHSSHVSSQELRLFNLAWNDTSHIFSFAQIFTGNVLWWACFLQKWLGDAQHLLDLVKEIHCGGILDRGLSCYNALYGLKSTEMKTDHILQDKAHKWELWVIGGTETSLTQVSETEGDMTSLLVHFKTHLQISTQTKEHSQKSISVQHYCGGSPYESTQESIFENT